MHFKHLCPFKLFPPIKNIYRSHIKLLHTALLTIGIIIIYRPVYHFKFLIGWDDQWFITNHYTANGLGWRNIWSIITSYYHGQYAPLNQLYYSFLYSLFKYNPTFYHLSGVLIHLINVLLVYLLMNTITIRLTKKPKIVTMQISFFTALLFAIAPINIEPVAWVSASKVILYALFYLIALNCYCRYLTDKKPVYFYLTLILFILSFGAKEQAILLPVCLVLFDYVFNRNLSNRIVWFEKVPFIVLALLFGIITLQSQAYYGQKVFYPFYQRIPLSLYTLIEYFTKCLIPVNISYLYPFPFLLGERVPWWLWIYVITIPAIIYCFYKRIKARWTIFGLFFFLIHIILVLNFFSLARYSFIADRYTYLACIGLFFIVSYLIVTNLYKFKSKVLSIIVILYLVSLISYSCIHITVWKNAYTVKERLKSTIESRSDFIKLKKIR